MVTRGLATSAHTARAATTPPCDADAERRLPGTPIRRRPHCSTDNPSTAETTRPTLPHLAGNCDCRSADRNHACRAHTMFVIGQVPSTVGTQ